MNEFKTCSQKIRLVFGFWRHSIKTEQPTESQWFDCHTRTYFGLRYRHCSNEFAQIPLKLTTRHNKMTSLGSAPWHQQLWRRKVMPVQRASNIHCVIVSLKDELFDIFSILLYLLEPHKKTPWWIWVQSTECCKMLYMFVWKKFAGLADHAAHHCITYYISFSWLEHQILRYLAQKKEVKRSNLLEMLRFDFDLSHAFQHVADAIEGFLAKDAEPLPDQICPRYSCEQMKSMLQHLAHALHFGDPAWPHTESQGKLAIQYLEVIAKSFVWGQKHDDGIVACFFGERGLSILIRALLTYQIPRSIKLQVYQSTCMIIQNAKDIRVLFFKARLQPMSFVPRCTQG